jgi:hypothetical protein
MNLMQDLPLDYFDQATGVSLTNAEVCEAVAAYLKTKGMLVEPSSFIAMAHDDLIVTFKAPAALAAA